MRAKEAGLDCWQKRSLALPHRDLACFRTAAKNLESKHPPEGIVERKKIVGKLVRDLERLLRWKDFLGCAAVHDDLLDALVGIGVAKASLRGSPLSLAAQQKRDR